MTDVTAIYDDLVRFETILWGAVDARLRRDCDLRLTWFEIMQLLHRNPVARTQDIANEFSITVGGVSKVIDRMVDADYCRRSPNPADGRSALISLTAEGTRKLEIARPVFEEELEKRFRSVLGPAELARLAIALKLLRVSAQHRDEVDKE